MKPGLLDSQYLIANLEEIQFARITVNLGMIHRSVSPPYSITFAFSLDPQLELNWCGHSVSPQQIVVHQSNSQANLFSKGPKDLAVITLAVQDFLSFGIHEDSALLKRLLSEKIHLLSLNKNAAFRLRNDLKEIFALIQN